MAADATILVINSDPAFVSRLDSVLTAGGYHVMQASGTREGEALLAAAGDEVSLVILDRASEVSSLLGHGSLKVLSIGSPSSRFGLDARRAPDADLLRMVRSILEQDE